MVRPTQGKAVQQYSSSTALAKEGGAPKRGGGLLHRDQKNVLRVWLESSHKGRGRDPRRPSSTSHRPHIDPTYPFSACSQKQNFTELRRDDGALQSTTSPHDSTGRLAGQMANGNGGPMGGLARCDQKSPFPSLTASPQPSRV